MKAKKTAEKERLKGELVHKIRAANHIVNANINLINEMYYQITFIYVCVGCLPGLTDAL